MKAKPLKLVPVIGYVEVAPQEATHVEICFPGPVGNLHLPVQQRGTREGTGNWTWNGDVDNPTLRPSVLTNGTWRLTDAEHATIMAGGHAEPRPYRCHTWVTDGQALFLDDCNHDLRGQVVDMVEVA